MSRLRDSRGTNRVDAELLPQLPELVGVHRPILGVMRRALPPVGYGPRMKVAVAFDHRGVHLRDAVLEVLEGHSVVDLGTDTDAVRLDYPLKAQEIGSAIQRGDAERGVFVCGSGVGASVAASKLPGIRAAVCHDVYSAHQGVEHDDMNVLCLGSEVVGPSLARDLVTTFLAARFNGGERYVRRLKQIEDLERAMSNA
jgi:ribose 5-phosphate isomerase B